MRQIMFYFRAQWKRALYLLPLQLLTDFAVCAAAGVLAFLLIDKGAAAAEGTRYRIGVVGDLSESYLGFGIAALQKMDDSRLMIELVSMSEEAAQEAFEKGDIYAVVRVPEGLMESIVYGENDRPITYTASQGQQGLGTMVMGEITNIASTLVTSSQSAIYAMQRMLADAGRGEEIGRKTDKLNLSLINLVLSRSGFGDVEILGYADGLSFPLYYLCSMVLLFLLFSGLLHNAFFAHGDASLSCFLKARGVGAFWQVLGEYAAYLGLTLAGFFVLFLPVLFGLGRGMIAIPEWEGLGATPFLGLIRFFIPAAAVFAAFQFFLYETAEGAVNGILLQLICGAEMGYLSGYFYPSAFLPEKMQALGGFLPSGAAMRLVEDEIVGKPAVYAGCAVFAWLVVFLLLTVAVRRSRIERN